ncbi:Riboflavin transporter [Roseovarius albus]|uniref:Riboflavin transporter n=1 Tax=Roseovarius albus TaxID=1247867 RepID=A0A1X6YZS9_9RHOB|nr:DMT family transporter [Roseovarius albus]SLN35957.1 Riboflavin transporter [Roseovarius albus]
MLGAVFAFSLMAIAGRAVSFELDTFEIMMYRSIIGLIAVLCISSLSGTLREITTRNLRLQVVRNISHFAAQNLWFFALPLIPLAQLFALEFTSPIWVLMLSPLLLSERLTIIRVVAAVTGFIGVVIVTQPGSANALNIGTIAAAVAAIGFACSIIFTKMLTRHESLTCILLWMTLLQSIFGVICAGYDGDITALSASTLPWLTVIAFCGLTAHFCLTKAVSMAPATVVVPVDFLRLPLIALIGFWFYQEPLSYPVILGAAIIFAANYLNLWNETK